MNETKNILNMLLVLILLWIAHTSCTGGLSVKKIVEEINTNVKPTIKLISSTKSEYFTTPYTLVVMLDSKACGGNLVETVWWSDWQQHMIENGNGFVFITSDVDSAGLVFTAHLDNVDAPILVYPEREKYLSDLWSPFHSIPLKLLLDSTATVKGMWLSITDSTYSNKLLDKIDSITKTKLSDVHLD
ncbi:MAG: hypothetical protein ACE5D6_03575 [Candidatus Zixiibacteriota bacterium]